MDVNDVNSTWMENLHFKVTSHLQRQKNAGAQISNKEVAIQPKFAILDVKKFPFMQVPALILKH